MTPPAAWQGGVPHCWWVRCNVLGARAVSCILLSHIDGVVITDKRDLSSNSCDDLNTKPFSSMVKLSQNFGDNAIGDSLLIGIVQYDNTWGMRLLWKVNSEMK